MKPLLLDAFCCQGGAAVGYARAGFDVVGVDLDPKHLRRYPFRSIRGDALDVIRRHGHLFDAIHASPPCQHYSAATTSNGGHAARSAHPDLIDPTRQALQEVGRPWIMENVAGARAVMDHPVTLCGSEFGLQAVCDDGWVRQLWRHRLFESNVFLMGNGGCRHNGEPVGVYGNGPGRKADDNQRRGYQASAGEAARALGIDWMNRRGLSQSIPPAYTDFLGAQLMDAL